jgi:TolB protein
VDGGNQRPFLTGTLNGLLPDWSPDGSKIAFVSGDDFSTQIYVINADGTGLVQLTDSQGYNEDPAWSPDGTMIAFWSSRTGNHEIFIMNADGTDPVNITNHPAADENPSWLPLR